LDFKQYLRSVDSLPAGTAGQYNLIPDYQVDFFKKDLNLASPGNEPNELLILQSLADSGKADYSEPAR
jgi:hypothetical protein